MDDKICIIFRGLNWRERPEGLVDPMPFVGNWQQYIFNDLDKQGISYDTVFITYPSKVLDDLCYLLEPKIVITEGYNSQMSNLRFVADWMMEHQQLYRKFIILRFDFWYKIPITQWPRFEEDGFIVINKDVSWENTFYISDFLFQIGSESVPTFRHVVYKPIWIPHEIGACLKLENIPYKLMYDDYFFYSKDHPMYSYFLDPRPNEKSND
jgi:hypothetical protein